MIQIKPTILDSGINAIFAANNQGLEGNISHIALGDGGGAGYVPNPASDGLRNERARIAVGGGERTGPQTITVQAHFQDTAAFWVHEVGFVLDDGRFLAIWSDEQTPLMYKTANGEVVLAFSLLLKALPENSVNVTVSGPDVNIIHDREFALIIANQARMTRQQFHQNEAFYAAHRYYPGV